MFDEQNISSVTGHSMLVLINHSWIKLTGIAAYEEASLPTSFLFFYTTLSLIYEL